MKSMFMNIGGPVQPRSKSRAVVRSLVRSPRSRWPTPSGPRVAAISRSLRTLLKWWPSRAPTTWWTGGATCETHEHDAERDQRRGQVGAGLDAADEEPGGDRQAGRDQRAHQQQQPPRGGEPGHRSGHA